MSRENWAALCVIAICLSAASKAGAGEVRGHYLEARTCQVYTGPCFANGEVGQSGKDAVMAWRITTGRRRGVDLAGLKVVVVVRSSHTLGFAGLDQADSSVRSLILVDEAASPEQHSALVEFARDQSGKAGLDVASVKTSPIQMELDTAILSGRLQAGDDVELVTRKARPGDCICSNEAAYYPPLAQVEYFAPGVTLDGEVTARPLGRRWSIPNSRTAYMATFAVE